MRALLRDADTDLIDRHLTNGGRAILVYLLLNEDGEIVTKWGLRAPELQELVVKMRLQLPDKEDPNHEQVQKEMYTKLLNQYVTDSMLWHYVYESFKQTVVPTL